MLRAARGLAGSALTPLALRNLAAAEALLSARGCSCRGDDVPVWLRASSRVLDAFSRRVTFSISCAQPPGRRSSAASSGCLERALAYLMPRGLIVEASLTVAFADRLQQVIVSLDE